MLREHQIEALFRVTRGVDMARADDNSSRLLSSIVDDYQGNG
jgi:hypothetical protein